MLNTWGQLLVLASIVTVLSLKYQNILFAIGATMSWLALLAYNLDNPPTGITQGSAVHEWLTMGFLVMAIAVFFMWVKNRRTISISGQITKSRNGEESEANINMEMEHRGLMDLSEDEYRVLVRKKLHPHNRRR